MVTVFFDFDGVFNFHGTSRNAYRKNPDALGYSHKTSLWVEDGSLKSWFNLDWSGELVRKVSALHEASSFKWVWLTTWTGNTDKLDRLFELENTVDAEWVAYPEKSAHWTDEETKNYRAEAKLQVVLNWVAAHPDEPFVWVDDEATALWLTEYATAPNLVLQPDEKYGLTRPELEQFETFVKAYS